MEELTIHCRNLHRVSVWEAEKDVEEDDQNTGYAVNHETCVTHPERS
jgi:hypothetical protein